MSKVGIALVVMIKAACWVHRWEVAIQALG